MNGLLLILRQLASSRALMVGIVMSSVFAAVVVKGGMAATAGLPDPDARRQAPDEQLARADILDRNGELLATTVTVYSLFADPRAIWDAEAAAQELATVFPDLDVEGLAGRLSNRERQFTWVRRGLTPRQLEAALGLGLEGLDYRTELRRAYPRGTLAGHVLGYTGLDGNGQAGVEYALDARLTDEKPPVRLTIDSGVQFALEAELAVAASTHEARGGAGVVLEARTGAVRGLASWPPLDPNRPPGLSDPAALNRAVGAVYELGSVFKPLTVAAGLESGDLHPADRFDISKPLAIRGYEITDTHPIPGPATVTEILAESSNKGTVLIAERYGIRRQRDFLGRLGLLEKVAIEIAGSAGPILPPIWDDLSSATISYGHGIAVSPLAFASAFSTFANNGELVPPTLLEGAAPERAPQRVMSAPTAKVVTAMLREAVTHGTGARADVAGYRVAGKTGTAEKPINGVYDEARNITSFAAVFPASSPEYVVLIVLDEPLPGATGGASAALNAAPAVGRVIERIAPLLGVRPMFEDLRRDTAPAVRSVSERRGI